MRRQNARRYALPPLPLKLLVVLLAFVQFVAPTWHVCALGGHVMSMGSGEAASHHSGAVSEVDDGPMRPLICYCAPKDEHQENPNWPKLTAAPSHGDHATCLALLLQTMPGAVASAPALVSSSALVEVSFPVRYESSPSLALLNRFRGRAPPLAA